MEKMELSMTNNNALKHLKIPGEAKIILDAFSQINFGKITITTPENLTIEYSGNESGPHVKLQIFDWDALVEVLHKSDIGLAESYMDKKFETSSISDLLEFSILNEKSLTKAFKGNLAKIIFYRLKHEARENSLFGSKKNIKEHYDLGNDFYQLWLDSSMTYSSALFKNKSESLTDAQLNKYQSMLDLINPKSTDHILEIGCGWGGFLEYAGKKGFRVTGITISDEQFKYAQERIIKNNLQHLCEVKLCDYRLLDGQFDCAVSIEMIEAVGEKYWDSYFSTFKKVIRPGGKFSIQAIVMNDHNFDSYRKGTDFIQQYVFPGGMLLSPNTLKNLCKKNNFEYLNTISFGLDYARTLNIWNDHFNAKIDEVKKLGFDERFIRLWNFYLGYCEGAFLSKRIDVLQISAEVK